MDLKIRGRVALVTGASAGIGEAVAVALAQEGAKVAIAARRRDRLDATVQTLRECGATEAYGVEVDLEDRGSIDTMLRNVEEELGPVDILVANSGGPKPGTYTEVDLDDWDRAYHAVLRNMLQLVNGVLPGMRVRRWGRIVALTSSSVKQPIPTLALSNSYRVALVAALKTLSLEVARDGITVNAIATGRVITDRLRKLYPSDEEMAHAADDIPAAHVATPAEFAPMVAFLCGEPAGYVTGQTIAIDGGMIKSLL